MLYHFLCLFVFQSFNSYHHWCSPCVSLLIEDFGQKILNSIGPLLEIGAVLDSLTICFGLLGKSHHLSQSLLKLAFLSVSCVDFGGLKDFSKAHSNLRVRLIDHLLNLGFEVVGQRLSLLTTG